MIHFKATDDTQFARTLFLIPSYQRGYRWQRDDVQKLLLDLTRFQGKEYCLQPLELQKTTRPAALKDDYVNYIRVVDGQQRLTTISIIARLMNIPLDWDIYYLVEGQYLSQLLQEDANEHTINAHFRHEVEDAVQEFADKESVARFIAPNSPYRIAFPVHFLPDDQGDATPEADRGQDAFNRLNAGKTPLTSSELIRALYMVHDSGIGRTQRIEIAKEWELIENTLANEQFWLMFNAVGLEKTPTRIDLLFALVLKVNLEHAKVNPRIVYEKLESGYYERRYDLKKVWGAVMECFWWMQSCYEDIERFNLLGWLAMCTGNQASTIYHAHLSYPVMEDFKKALVYMIQNNGICETEQQYFNPRLKDLLLLCNALECTHSNERLRYDLLDAYDVEHIDSRRPNDLHNEDDRRQWLESVWDEHEDFRNGMTREEFSSQPEDETERIISSLIWRDSVKDINGLGNLALLNRSINRSYKNAVFPAKRKRIRQEIMNGEQYILPCTAKAFMKFYTEETSQIHAWLQVDFDNYQRAMNDLMDEISSQPAPPEGALPRIDLAPDNEDAPEYEEPDAPAPRPYERLQGEVSFETIMNTYRICIPNIQRLYVQGRQDSFGRKCLDDFASVLVESVCNGTPCPLDMIYGIADGNLFYPMDGQQRLTTLLLLSWLCGKANGNTWSFDYESRRSTELFIGHLLNTPAPSFAKPENYDEQIKNGYLPICTEYLEKQPWFMPIWKKDSGISGMLNMLDSLYDKLLQRNVRDFRFDGMTFSINYLDVTATEYDHIFLKMNSRGRQLTTWENVKAVIDKYAQNHPQWTENINLTWPERIWEQVDERIAVLDNNMFTIISEALAYAGYKGKVENTFQLDKWMESNPDMVRRFLACAETLFSATEITDDALLAALKPSWEENPLTPDFGSIDASCKKHLAAYYGARKSTNAEWMRVVWNILENSEVGSNLPGALNLIDELANHCEDILGFLAGGERIHSRFAEPQVEEECIKAHLIRSDNTWRAILENAEAYPFLKGRVAVILIASESKAPTFSAMVSACVEHLQNQETTITFFKSYLPYAQMCDLPLTYDRGFFKPDKWKRMFFNDLRKNGVIEWLKSIANLSADAVNEDWATNLLNHWDEICPDGPNEYWQIAQYSHGWDNNKVFLYRTGNITRAQLISSSLREDLINGLRQRITCGSNAWHHNHYNQIITLDNGLTIEHEPNDFVWVKNNEQGLAAIGTFTLPMQLTQDNLDEFIQACLEYDAH